MATGAYTGAGDRPYLCGVVESIRKKISQPRPQFPLTPSLGDDLQEAGATTGRRRRPILSPASLGKNAHQDCSHTIPEPLAQYVAKWCDDRKIEEFQVLTSEDDSSPTEDEKVIAVYRLDNGSGLDNGTTRAHETSLDGYEVNGKISIRVGEAKQISEAQKLEVVLGSGQVPDVLERLLRKAAPGWGAEVFAMHDKEVSQMETFARNHGIGGQQQFSGSLIHYRVKVDEVVQIRDIGNGKGDLIKRRTRIGKGEFPVDCILDDDADVDIEFKSLTTPGIALERCNVSTGSSKIPEVIASAIKLMLREEHAVVQARGKYLPKWASGDQESIQVVLHGYKLIASRNWPTMGPRQVVDAVNALRSHANALLQEGKVEEAERRYRRMLQQAKNIAAPDDSNEPGDALASLHEELLSAIAKTQVNHAKALHSMGLAREAMKIADEVAHAEGIEMPLQLKHQALYRKARCALSLDEDDIFEAAVERIQKMEQSESLGQEAQKEIATVATELRSFQAKNRGKGFYKH